MSGTNNLNFLSIPDADGNNELFQHYSTISESGETAVFFRNLEHELIKRIKAADLVVGCVAWLTNEAILTSLATKKGVAIVVQKEDFLRPDIDVRPNWSRKLHEFYRALPSTLSRYDDGLSGTALHMLSYAGDPTIQAIRCVGNHNSEKSPAFPRAHHKFVVFCRALSTQEALENWDYEPYEVWTGSFNFTKNAVYSLENAIVSKDKKIIKAFYEEWAQIEAISEPLDWESRWVEPQWRIGS